MRASFLALGLGLVALLNNIATAADRVTVQLDYLVRGSHAMFFVADQKGYFREQGIELVAVRSGTSSSVALSDVGAGSAEFGFADFPTLAVSRMRGIPVVALVAVNQKESACHDRTRQQKDPQKPGGSAKASQSAFSLPDRHTCFSRPSLPQMQMSLKDIKQSTVTPRTRATFSLGK